MTCDHALTEMRRRVYANGTDHVGIQCLTCGTQVSSVKKSSLSSDDLDSLEWWDDGLSQDYWESVQQEQKANYQASLAERRQAHQEYLESPEWTAKRRKRLDLDGNLCQAKLDGCQRWASQVHHLNYRFWGNEPMWDLQSVCRSCHEQISAMEGRIDREGAA
ncbi:MAG: hypothetical protein ACR2OE_04130 [Thermomicrobiales bacterium]